MAYTIGVIALVVGIIVSIALHEMGHMIPAKAFGVRVSQYMVGFGPTIWSRARGETEYGVKWIMLGGYVRLIGMYPPGVRGGPSRRGRVAEMVHSAREASAADILPGQESRAFYHLSAPKKLVVMLGGPVMNLVIAAVLLAITQVGFGVLVPDTTVRDVAPCVAPVSAPAGSECTAAADGAAPAAAAGIEPGDTVLSIDGVATPTWDDVLREVGAAGTDPLTITIKRDDRTITRTVTPTLTERPGGQTASGHAEQVPVIGIGAGYSYQRQSWSTVPQMMGEQLSAMGHVIVTLPQQVWQVAQSAFDGAPRSQSSVVSVVGVGRIAGEVASASTTALPSSVQVVSMLNLLASLNIALFAFNLIPLPPLDGGHVAGALYEGLKRRWARWRGRARPGPADTARLVPLAYGVFVLLFAMGAVLMYADIVSPVAVG